MTTAQLINGFLLAAALIFASFTPGKELRGTVMSGLGVAISWALVIWSYHGGLWAPAFILTDISRESVSPYAVWAIQDAALSAWLASVYLESRSRVCAIVGLVFAGQVAFHAMQAVGLSEPVYLAWLEFLFYAQLTAIAALGGREIGQRVIDWLRPSRDWSVGRSSLRRSSGSTLGYRFPRWRVHAGNSVSRGGADHGR